MPADFKSRIDAIADEVWDDLDLGYGFSQPEADDISRYLNTIVRRYEELYILDDKPTGSLGAEMILDAEGNNVVKVSFDTGEHAQQFFKRFLKK